MVTNLLSRCSRTELLSRRAELEAEYSYPNLVDLERVHGLSPEGRSVIREFREIMILLGEM